jgi:hypothetical protein
MHLSLITFCNTSIRVANSDLHIHAEVVTFVAGSLEAGGLHGGLEVPVVLK